MSNQPGSTLNAPAEAPEKGVVCDALVSLRWETGIPDTLEGGRQAFWCAVKNHRGGISHVALEYLNRHVMQCSDSCEPGDSAVLVPGSDDEYFWTGWFEPSCDHCETQWNYTGEVVAWIRLPRFQANTKTTDAEAIP